MTNDHIPASNSINIDMKAKKYAKNRISANPNVIIIQHRYCIFPFNIAYDSNFIIKATAQNRARKCCKRGEKMRIGIVLDLRYGGKDLALT